MEKDPTVVELVESILKGINAERYLPDLDLLSPAERGRLEEGVEQRNVAKGALRHLLVLAEHFGWPEQLPLEKTQEEFVARRSAELAEVKRRVNLELTRLGDPERSCWYPGSELPPDFRGVLVAGDGFKAVAFRMGEFWIQPAVTPHSAEALYIKNTVTHWCELPEDPPPPR